MSINPLLLKLAYPYSNALYDYAIEQNEMYGVAQDLKNLSIFLQKSDKLAAYLKNPLVTISDKEELITKALKSRLYGETFRFLIVLIKRNRISLLEAVVPQYFKLIYRNANVKSIEISVASPLTIRQKNLLLNKLKKLTNSRAIVLEMTIDPNLISGIIVQTPSKRVDFTIKNRLLKLSQHLNTTLNL